MKWRGIDLALAHYTAQSLLPLLTLRERIEQILFNTGGPPSLDWPIAQLSDDGDQASLSAPGQGIALLVRTHPAVLVYVVFDDARRQQPVALARGAGRTEPPAPARLPIERDTRSLMPFTQLSEVADPRLLQAEMINEGTPQPAIYRTAKLQILGILTRRTSRNS